MNIRILLSCTAALAITAAASAGQVASHDEATGANLTTRIPGSIEIVPPRVVSPSFEPMEAPRAPCTPMILTSTTIEAFEMSSFAPMADKRHPVVSCEPVHVAQAAYVPPPPVVRPPDPPPPPPPYVEPVPYEPPVELPHTGSRLPLVGLIGLLALGGAALVRAGRSFQAA